MVGERDAEILGGAGLVVDWWCYAGAGAGAGACSCVSGWVRFALLCFAWLAPPA